jgi:phenylalanyl-tRNA synthetase beta chain
MNILVLDSWLREFLKTKAKPKQIASALTLCSQSVEKIIRQEADWLYEVEITTNRADCLSIYGLARELNAILPQFKFKTQLLPIHRPNLEIPQPKAALPLKVKISNPALCPRFTALIFQGIKIGPSPKIIQERLTKCGIRALNNVVDISNYLMLELGQPMHTFDYDKIGKAQMTLRLSKKGETLMTLDDQLRKLPEGTIIIEDGEGRIIDLCGIMGGANSQVDKKTKRVLLFVQTYNPALIRQACQGMSFRTEAAQRFEKGIEPEGVIPAIKKATLMFQKNCQAQVASSLIDIYPKPDKLQTVSLSQQKLKQVLGIEIGLQKARTILASLGFTPTINSQGQVLTAGVPHWRSQDITLPEDLIEEIARIYGYHRLPSSLPGGITGQETNLRFKGESLVKSALKFWGFTEAVNYSLVGEKVLKQIETEPADYLELANPLTEDLVYLRQSLIPSLLQVNALNQSRHQKIRLFELANIYLKRGKNQLPEEKPYLSGTLGSPDFFQAKGVVEEILKVLRIKEAQFMPYAFPKTLYGKIFSPGRAAEILFKNYPVGVIGEINPLILRRFNLKQKVVAFELDFRMLLKFAFKIQKYTPISKYPTIIEDFSLILPPQTPVVNLWPLIKSISPVVRSVELYDSYKDIKTIRIVFQSRNKTLSDKEVGKLRFKIITALKEKLGAKLKQKE